ncbi:Predicted ABC-type ATPase [Bradyrhizobium sp. Rc3b]|nr:Predicted ABC-type ATPase [Bradyrhizobium sp. Rc3b]
MVAGPNGSGKTTLTQYLRDKGIDFGVYINPDDIAKTLEGTYDDRVRAAQSEADTLRERCIHDRASFSFETVMSHPSKLAILGRANAAGFKTSMFFVGTDDPTTNIARVAARVELGGHDVPRNKIVDRWHRTMNSLREAMRIVDESFVFDNSSIDFGPRLILRLENVDGHHVARHVNAQFIPPWAVNYCLWPESPLEADSIEGDSLASQSR